MAYYVRHGDTIQDVAFNVTGSLAGIDPILELNTPDDVPMLDWKTIKESTTVPESNFMESYTPNLKIDQALITDGLVVENLEAVNSRSFNSTIMDETEVQTEIFKIEETLLQPYLMDQEGALLMDQDSQYLIATS